MIEIIAAPLTRLRRQQHLALMNNLGVLVEGNAIVKEGLGDLYAPFKIKLAQETVAVELEQGSLTTNKMDDKKEERQKLLSGFNSLVDSALHHFDGTKQEAAQVLKHLMGKYGGLSKKVNADQTVDVRAMCTELQAPENVVYLSQLSDGPEWISRLQIANEEYDALYRQRNSENNAIQTVTSSQARAEIDPCYAAIIRRVTSLIDLRGEADFTAFVNQLNGFITDLKTTMNMQATARKKANDKDAAATETAK